MGQALAAIHGVGESNRKTRQIAHLEVQLTSRWAKISLKVGQLIGEIEGHEPQRIAARD
jgi:hypothetical protein